MELKPNWLLNHSLILTIPLLFALAALTILRNAHNQFATPVVWLLSGLVTIGTAFWKSGMNQGQFKVKDHEQLRSKKWGGFIAGFLVCSYLFHTVIYEYPIDPRQSDIIPAIHLYIDRLINGSSIYQAMPMGEWTVYPNYLPMMWLPFTLAELPGIDYRWLAFLVFSFSVLIWVSQLKGTEEKFLIHSTLPWICLAVFLIDTPEMFGHSVELLYVGFYLFLAYAIIKRNATLLSIGIILCLLSRFSFTFWLPVFLLIFLLEEPKRMTFQMVYGIGIGLCTFLLPFLLKEPYIFKQTAHTYSRVTFSQWQAAPWQQEGSLPYSLAKGYGFPIYFFKKHKGSLQEKIHANNKTQVCTSLLAALLLLAGYFYLRKKKGFRYEIYAVIGLSFYLTVFYAFISVPFSYLYLVPFFMLFPAVSLMK